MNESVREHVGGEWFFGLAIGLLLSIGLGLPALAQEGATEPAEAELISVPTDAGETAGQPVPPVLLLANAGEDRNVAVGRTVLFDASATTVPTGAVPVYAWDFGDGTGAEGIDAAHMYDRSGTYRVTLTVTIGTSGSPDYEQSQTSIIVSVQDRLVTLITDQSVSKEQVDQLQDYALTQGVLIIPVRDTGVDQEYQTVQNLAQKLLKKQVDVAASDFVITWTAGNVGLNSLIELSRVTALNGETLEAFGFNTKAVVAVNETLLPAARTAQSAFQAVSPAYVIVADEHILDDVIRASSPEELQKSLALVDANYQVITEYTERGLQQLGPFNFMSIAVNYMVNRGVPINSLYLILMLPVMATIIAAARQLVGIKAFGIFAPTVIALSFLATGLKYGIVIFIAIIILGTVSRLLAKKFRLLYLPRMALVLSVLALSIFGMFLVGAYLGKTGFVSIAIFPILIMTVLTEHFVAVQIEQGYKAATKLTLETLTLSIIGFLIGDWTVFKTTILAYPELILLTLLFNYLLGKFSGLRLMEYLRFRRVYEHMRNAEKSE